MKTILRSKAEKMTVVQKMMAGFPEVKIEILIEEPMPNAKNPVWIVKSGFEMKHVEKCRSSKSAETAAMALAMTYRSPFHVNTINILWRGVRSTQSISR